MKRIDRVYRVLEELCMAQYNSHGEINGVSAIEVAQKLKIQRTNASKDLNDLCRSGRISKVEGKPVLYKIDKVRDNNSLIMPEQKVDSDVFENIIGAKFSLKNAIQQARAAIMYPPNGLHTLILGETGTGKSMFAEIMYEYAKSIGRIKNNGPFIAFNCADYASNPQLLLAQLFGVKKGAYTGADKDRSGIVEKADEGILFLDEVHRLPPEGQEMLFYLIDKGLYRRLGESEVYQRANVLIICATTENIESVLLKTFIRRIPMIIKLPPLRERTIEERYEIIKSFFKVEAESIRADINVTSNAMKALLLYDCTNNIGQLKSDIKLSCAKAFLGYMMKRDNNVCVHSEDLPEYVRRGLFKYKEYKDKLDKFVSEDVLTFSLNEDEVIGVKENKSAFNFYEALENKRKALESNGLDEKDIKLIMSLDIETYLKKYMSSINKDNLEELYKVVDKKIVSIVNDFLDFAGKKLGKQFSSRIFYGLSMHVSSSIERLLKGNKIENSQIDDIKLHYKAEFEVARELKRKIEEHFNVDVPEDEVGFITMFLRLDNDTDREEGRVSVVVAMHGESAATSIADVANRLLGENHVIGYNMPLEQKPETALENLTEIIKRADKGRGAILLVDMGSLVFFGDMIYERTGIPVKTVEMVSTPVVLEAARKALLNSSLEEIYQDTVSLSPYVGKIFRDSFKYENGVKKNVIVTACITGHGAALKLKSILERKFQLESKNVDIIPIDISDRSEFKNKLEKIKREKNVLAVVSALDPQDSSILYISTSDLFNNNKISILYEKIISVDVMEALDNMKEVLEADVEIDGNEYIEIFKKFYAELLSEGVVISVDSALGAMLHIACVVERCLKGQELASKPNHDLMKKHTEKFKIVRKALRQIEDAFKISISDDECVNIMKLIYTL